MTTRSPSARDPETIRTMFNAIAPTYDLLNHLLSFGLDIRWRRQALGLLREKAGGRMLDIAAGSGDLTLDAIALLKPREIVATDFAETMLGVFRKKLDRRNAAAAAGGDGGNGASPGATLIACDAHALPFRDCSFDATMVAFGIRNFRDRLLALREMRRVLTPGGLSVILELTTPTRPVIRQCYRLYAGGILPAFGRIISRHNDAYRYLPESIARFPEKGEFLSLMETAGFRETEAVELTFGVATAYCGRR